MSLSRDPHERMKALEDENMRFLEIVMKASKENADLRAVMMFGVRAVEKFFQQGGISEEHLKEFLLSAKYLLEKR